MDGICKLGQLRRPRRHFCHDVTPNKLPARWLIADTAVAPAGAFSALGVAAKLLLCALRPENTDQVSHPLLNYTSARQAALPGTSLGTATAGSPRSAHGCVNVCVAGAAAGVVVEPAYACAPGAAAAAYCGCVAAAKPNSNVTNSGGRNTRLSRQGATQAWPATLPTGTCTTAGGRGGAHCTHCVSTTDRPHFPSALHTVDTAERPACPYQAQVPVQFRPLHLQMLAAHTWLRVQGLLPLLPRCCRLLAAQKRLQLQLGCMCTLA